MAYDYKKSMGNNLINLICTWLMISGGKSGGVVYEKIFKPY
jgi:hypothetical protein